MVDLLRVNVMFSSISLSNRADRFLDSLNPTVLVICAVSLPSSDPHRSADPTSDPENAPKPPRELAHSASQPHNRDENASVVRAQCKRESHDNKDAHVLKTRNCKSSNDSQFNLVFSNVPPDA